MVMASSSLWTNQRRTRLACTSKDHFWNPNEILDKALNERRIWENSLGQLVFPEKRKEIYARYFATIPKSVHKLIGWYVGPSITQSEFAPISYLTPITPLHKRARLVPSCTALIFFCFLRDLNFSRQKILKISSLLSRTFKTSNKGQNPLVSYPDGSILSPRPCRRRAYSHRGLGASRTLRKLSPTPKETNRKESPNPAPLA